MVLYLKKKSQVNALLAKGFLDVRGESPTTQVQEERSKVEQRCFKCQKYRHLARTCKKMTVYRNCAETGHYHQDFLITKPKCTICGGSHRAKDHRPQQKKLLSSTYMGKQPELQRPGIEKSLSSAQEVNPFNGVGINNSAHRPKIVIQAAIHIDAPALDNE